MAETDTPGFRKRLIYRFEKQAEFAAGYSPLFTRLWQAAAAWLRLEHPLGRWLADVARTRKTFDVPLLFGAGIHRSVLAGHPEADELAAFFPTAGGSRTADDPPFEQVLVRAVSALDKRLSRFITTQQVQTNETGRGLCWLLPVSYTGWRKIHLLDLGASAGLNLLAERRSYTIVHQDSALDTVQLGSGRPPQFTVRSHGDFSPPPAGCSFEILSRTGCDKNLLSLAGLEDELTLAAFIWGDQVERMARLTEGIQALRGLEQEGKGITLCKVDLPGELEGFLHGHVPLLPACPVVLYNTYLTNYLSDKGASLFSVISRWAKQAQQPIVWLQMEVSPHRKDAPQRGWVLWQADLWHGDEHCHWDLGWCHPHAATVRWLPGIEQWARFWR